MRFPHLALTLVASLAVVSVLGCGDDEGGGGGDAASDTGGTTGDTGTAVRDTGPPPRDTGVSPVDSGGVGNSLSSRYPGDEGIASDPAVLFHDDFETGWGRWDRPTDDTRYLTMESAAATAHAGTGYLRSTVTEADLAETMYISASPRFAFPRSVDTVYWRFHARFPNVAPNPHHWVRMAAGDAGWNSSGLANTVPPGDSGFWFDFDINNDDVFNFYTYWHAMRSGRCNDGSATPGCAGDQGSTYYYGNVFRPNGQTPFARDEWLCVEMAGSVNTVGARDGWLAFWLDDVEVGRYAPGTPDGTWLRATFHEGGCEFSACAAPTPFEGFDFRTEADVQFKAIFLDAYYQADSTARKRMNLEERGLTVSGEMTILYDDVVVATERIGCRR